MTQLSMTSRPLDQPQIGYTLFAFLPFLHIFMFNLQSATTAAKPAGGSASSPVATSAPAKPTVASPSQAKPTVANPAHAKPAVAGPAQAKPAVASPAQAKPTAAPVATKPVVSSPKAPAADVPATPAAVEKQLDDWTDDLDRCVLCNMCP